MTTVYQGISCPPQLTRTGCVLVRIGVRVSGGTVRDIAGSLRRRHERNGVRWKRLDPLSQAALTVAYLRTSLTHRELAEGFGIPVSTCWNNIQEGISVLADRGRRISLRDVARLAVKMGWVRARYDPVLDAGTPTASPPMIAHRAPTASRSVAARLSTSSRPAIGPNCTTARCSLRPCA